MNKRLLFVALFFAVLTGIFTISYMRSIESRKLKGFEMETVVVAATDIPARSVITQDMIEISKVPKAFLQPGTYKTLEDVVGKVSLVPIKAGTQIQSDLIVDLSQVRGLSALIPSGYRTVTINVNMLTGAAGLIIPGDVVDLYCVLEPDLISEYVPGLVRKPTVIVPFENLLVLAVGQKLPMPTSASSSKEGLLEQLSAPGGATTITFAVSPDTAQDLLLLQRIATLYVVPKPIGEKEYIPLKAENTYDVLRKYLGIRRVRRRITSQYVEIYEGHIIGQGALTRNVYKVTSTGKVYKVQSNKAPRGGAGPLGGMDINSIMKTVGKYIGKNSALLNKGNISPQQIQQILDKIGCPGGKCSK